MCIFNFNDNENQVFSLSVFMSKILSIQLLKAAQSHMIPASFLSAVGMGQLLDVYDYL